MDALTSDAPAVLDQKWQSKSILISFVALISILSYAALRVSAPSNALVYAPLLSPPSVPHTADDDQLQGNMPNQTVENQGAPVRNVSRSEEQAPVDENQDALVPNASRSEEQAPVEIPADEHAEIESKCKDQQQEAEGLSYERKVTEVFERAAMPDKTIIITTLNAAWAEDDTMIDMFLESFWHGDGTHTLLQHLVIVCVDEKAYQRCLRIHPHCLSIITEGVDFTGQKLLLSADFIKLMWKRIEFLGSVLAMNYSFIFTDTDVLWFRNPFPLLQSDTEADLQIACDHYNGRPWDVHNSPNTGFIYARPNARTMRLFAYWYEQRIRDPLLADQGMLNAIKYDEAFTSIGLKMKFIDTKFLGGFCGLHTTDMTMALTMHATCCKGLAAKLKDLRMMLDGWTAWRAGIPTLPKPSMRSRKRRQKRSKGGVAPQSGSGDPKDPRFKVPLACIGSWHEH